MFRFLALPIIFSLMVVAAVFARQRRRRTSFRRAHHL